MTEVETMNDVEIRSFDCAVDTEESKEGKRTLTGRAIVFGQRTNIGPFDEIIEREAITPEVLRDVPLLLNHDMSGIPLARSRNNNTNSTMQLSVVPGKGMEIRVDLDTENNTEAKNLYSAVKRGDISGMSFMFTTDADEWEDMDTDYPTRTITQIGKVFEVSAVTFPAYEATSIAARGLSDALEGAKTSLESAKASKEAIEKRKRLIRLLTEV
jgi:HK97 family phage prohead protease